MKFDLTLLLTFATILCFLIWLVDALFYRRTRLLNEKSRSAHTNQLNPDNPTKLVDKKPWLVEYALAFLPVLLIALILRSFVVEPTRIPSGSMVPTLLNGDFILINKFSYGIKLPLIHKTILETGSPSRGDVAVFRFPNNPQLAYIMRVVGLPGDKIVYRDKVLSINGEPVEVSDSEQYLSPVTGEPLPGRQQSIEKLFGLEYGVLKISGRESKEQSWDVPAGHYFMMGDNRDNSHDSRGWGFIPEKNLIGKATYIWMNFHEQTVLWNRIGDHIQ